jgi:hypothetical protein
MTICKTLSLALIALLFGACAAPNATHSTSTATADEFAGRSITPADAKSHIGKRMTVCGVVASANYDAQSRRDPTFLNLDESYLRQIFTAPIWGEDREKFGTP